MRKEASKPDDVMIEAMRRVGHVANDLGLPVLVIGATARMLLLEQVHGLEPGRRTLDVDYGVAVGGWNDDIRLRAALVENAEFVPDPKRSQRMFFREVVTIDIIPFGGVENELGEIEWPDEDGVKLNVLGLSDLISTAVAVDVGAGLQVPVISAEGLLASKLVAWQERRKTDPGRDVADIGYVLRNAEKIIGLENLYADHMEAVAINDYRTNIAGAHVLGANLATKLRESVREQLQRQLDAQLNEESELVRDLCKFAGFVNPAGALALLEGFARGLAKDRTP